MKTPLAPHITEKAYSLISEEKGVANHYTFKVARTLRKEAIKAIIEREFKVHVTNIRTINLPGKVRVFKGKAGHTQASKKAIVRLKVGEKIAAFDIDTKEETK
jgi:large subunit ribosomal protein L23